MALIALMACGTAEMPTATPTATPTVIQASEQAQQASDTGVDTMGNSQIQVSTPISPPEAPVGTVAPSPIPIVEPVTYPEGSIEAIICALPWPCWEAIAVAACESGRDANGYLDGNWATNGNHLGLFQMSTPLWDHLFEGEWSDPYYNALAAWKLYHQSGDTWAHWSCKPW